MSKKRKLKKRMLWVVSLVLIFLSVTFVLPRATEAWECYHEQVNNPAPEIRYRRQTGWPLAYIKPASMPSICAPYSGVESRLHGMKPFVFLSFIYDAAFWLFLSILIIVLLEKKRKHHV